MSDRPRLSVPEVVRLVGLIAGPASPADWAARAPGEFPATCRFCGDAALIELRPVDGSVRIVLSHDVPLCPEFARAIEEQP